MAEVPLPSFELLDRVGSERGAADPVAAYEAIGLRSRRQIDELLPADWTWDGKRVLDFGCGAGRVLRHFLDVADRGAELWGCDIDRPSIAWLDANLNPPIHPFANDEAPQLSVEDGQFDLVYAISVFTHLTDLWAEWLLEMHRVLKPGGILIATFLGPAMYPLVARPDDDEDRIGMNVLNYGQSWDEGGPTVLHSRWWIESHWGRAFELLELRPDGFAHPSGTGHGVAVMSRTEVELEPGDLTALEPDDPREIAALQSNVEQLHRQNRLKLDSLQGSASWRLTRPLRTAKKKLHVGRRPRR